MRVLSISHERDAGPGVFAEAVAATGAELDDWHIAETTEPPADPAGYDAVMMFGGSMHPDQDDRHAWLAQERELLRRLVERRVPVLGVCLGAQILAAAAGGEAHRAPRPEIGWFDVEVTEAGAEDPLLAPLAPRFEAFEWHSYAATPPPGARVLARTPVSIQAYRLDSVPAWGIQFHAEVSAADASKWIDDYDSDEEAVRIGVDPEALRSATEARIGAQNELGRELCLRFLEAASDPSSPAA
jgi:GMP synthase (glutamine-hydrolysing)